MSEFKGTKGKWKAKGYNVYSDNDENIEFIHGNIICSAPKDLYRSMENWQFNAKLISCAPELLESLKEIHDLLEENLPNWYLKGHHVKISELIKKATE